MLNLIKLTLCASQITMMLGALLLFPFTARAEKIWTLESSIQRAIQTSPYILAADAEVDSKKGSLLQAGAWPNPTIELGGSDKLKVNVGKKGNDFMEASISQSLPIIRLLYQRKHALSELQAANYERFYQQLLQENKAALTFHNLQLTQANLKLAKEQLDFANRYQQGKDSKDPLVRYISKLDSKRLNIILAVAEQEVAGEEGQYSEALSNFRTLLNLPQDSPSKTAQMTNVQLSAPLIELLKFQDENNAAIAAAKYKMQAADTSVSLERSKLFPEPSVKYYREKDFLHDKNQFFNGVTVNFTLPLWNFNKGGISKAKADANKAKYELLALERDLQAKLRQSHMHLKHLIEQTEHYRTNILVQAKEVFTLTHKSFSTGGVNILALIDANNTYFESHKRYLKLLYEASVEAANLKLIAGLSLQVGNNPNSNDGEKS